MSHYPNTPGFTGVLRPIRLEGDILDMEVEGEIPSGMGGTAFHFTLVAATTDELDED